MKAAATLTITNAARMSLNGRAAVAEWLMRQGGELIREGRHYAPRFRARYLYQRKAKT